MKVAFLTRYDERRASSRVRAFRYAGPLAELGIQCRFLPWANRPRRTWPAYTVRALALARWADVVVLQKPFQPPWFVDLLAGINPRIVVDVDDAVWEPVGGDGDDATRAAELGRRLDHAASRAVAIVAGSRYLAGCLHSRGAGVVPDVVPSSVELDRFPVREHRDAHPVVVGWIGSPENLADFDACRGVLARLVAAGTAVLRVVSSAAPAFDGIPAEFVPWSASGEPREVARFDIGIMPLRDTPRSRGRCGFKAVEYMAAGVPVVSSALAGPSEVVEHGVTGFLAGDEAGWEEHLVALGGDPDLRRRMGEAGRRMVAERYSTSANAPRLAEILARAAGRPDTVAPARTSEAQR